MTAIATPMKRTLPAMFPLQLAVRRRPVAVRRGRPLDQSYRAERRLDSVLYSALDSALCWTVWLLMLSCAVLCRVLFVLWLL